MHYIFIVNDFPINDKIYTGQEIADTLLEKNCWIFAENAPNIKKMNPGDKVIVYVAGKGNRFFYANFEILEKIKEHKMCPSSEETEVLYAMFPLGCSIKVLSISSKPVKIADVKEQLNFITDKKNYGLFLRQSTKIISKKNYDQPSRKPPALVIYTS